MNHDERIILGKAMAACALYYGRQLNQDALTMMLDDLDHLSLTEALNALGDYRRNRKHRSFPLPADLLDIARPEVDNESAAREIAARINGALVKFGNNNGALAKVFIGEIGWQIVQRFGGWGYLCRELGVSIDTINFQAQARELAKSYLKFTPEEINRAIGAGENAQAITAFIPKLIKQIE